MNSSIKWVTRIGKQQNVGGTTGYLLLILMLPYPLFPLAQTTPPSDPVEKMGIEFEKIPRVAVPERPFLFVNKEEIALARKRAETEDWAKNLKDSYLKIADTWINRDYDFIKKIIPPKGSIYTYGLGLNLDPVEQKKMTWRGWDDPRHVVAANGIIYPNGNYLDEGMGWLDPESGTRYYFMALANGMTIHQLESADLPALVNAYALTGNETYAERALWILDAIAAIYPRAYEGPIDYPHNAPGRSDGGRLDRPYYQAARALMNYGYFAELLSMSRHAGKPSRSVAGYTMLKNIELNLLMNGADYCLRMARSGQGASYELNNGNIDYNRAPLLVGALLGIPEWVDWALDGPLGFRNALRNTIDINGRYFETGTSYASHTRELLLSTARFLKRMRLPAYPFGYAAYDDTRFALFALDFFTGIQVAGRLPLFGDAGPDAAIIDDYRIFDKGTLMAAHEFYRYSEKREVRAEALLAGAKMLQDMPDGFSLGGQDLFHSKEWDEFIQHARQREVAGFERRSSLFFDYGTLILRSGTKENERAALLRFGPTLNHGQADELGLAFYAKGREFSFDPGYYNTHFRFGFTTTTVAHNTLVVNRKNQLREPSSGADLQTWTDGNVLRSAALDNPQAYADERVEEYKRRVALIDLSDEESYIIDNFWARGGREYDYSLHGIMKGEFQVLPSSETVLKKSRNGSVLSGALDYAAEMDPNGRIHSFADKPFYFAPPGAGYGFLSRPSFYTLGGPAYLQWSATDGTDHRMYVSHFAPQSAQLIIAAGPAPEATIQTTYALSNVKTAASDRVRFTSVILPTKAENKLRDVQQLLPQNGAQETFALRLMLDKPDRRGVREHLYMASHTVTPDVSFDAGLSFSGEEGFLGLDTAGKVMSASLTGTGYIHKHEFKFTVMPLFNEPLKILEVKEQPLRVLVNAPATVAKQLMGSIVRLNKPELSRPFVLRVNRSEAARDNHSWLILDASGNVHAIGTVKSYDQKANSLTTDAPMPHARPYLYRYDDRTGMPGGRELQTDYNGAYNGFRLVSVDQKGKEQHAMIKNLVSKRTQILLDNRLSFAWKTGDPFEIRLLAPGDLLEIPVWAEAERGPEGRWQIKGNGKAVVEE